MASEVVGKQEVESDWLVIKETESGPWVPNIFSWRFLCVFLLWTLAVGYLSGRRQGRIIEDVWLQKVKRNVSESLMHDAKLRAEEEEEQLLKKVSSSKQRKIEAPELGHVLWTIGGSVCIASVAGWALCHSETFRNKAEDSLKKAYEATMTLYYTPEPVEKALGQYRITHIFTGVNAARQAGKTLQSPQLHMKGMKSFGRFTLTLLMNGDALHKGAVGLRIDLSKKPAAAAESGGVALMEVKSYTLRLMPLPSTNGTQETCKKELDPRITTAVPDMLSKEEFEAGPWTKDDALVAQVDVILA